MPTDNLLAAEVKSSLEKLLSSMGPLFTAYPDAASYAVTSATLRWFPDGVDRERAVRCLVSLELLDLAITTSLDGPTLSIMLPDHLMAHAIDQVMPLGDPRVVATLAEAISAVAADRASGAGVDEYRSHLLKAAEILLAAPGQEK